MIDFERPLPASLDSERAILGALMERPGEHLAAFGLVVAADFSLESHRRIFGRMLEIDQSGGRIDGVTVAEALRAHKQLDSIGGLSYLAGLGESLPEVPNLESYIEIVKEKSALRRLIFAAQSLQLRCFDPGDSASDIIQAGEKLLLDISETGKHKSAEMMNPGQVVEDAGGLQKFLSPMRGAGISTPFSRLTEITGGYRRGELIVIAGNPGMGKTSLGIQAAGHVAEQGEGALVFSMEMSRAALVERIACSRARVDSARLRAGYVTAEERARLSKAVTEIWDWPLWIAENGVSNTLAIRAALRRQRQKGEVFMLVIDYLQLMKPIGKFQNRHAEISEITRSLKLLAMDEKVNIQLLSQLTRENMREKRPPALHDLRESSSIESDADSVQAAWREELLRPDRDDLKGLADLIVLKQRNGRIGKIQLIFVANFSKFEARAEDLPYAPTPERSPYND